MKHWLGRTPRTVGDWLGLALGTALIFGGVAQLPALAAALGRLAVILRPFLWGLVLAYVVTSPPMAAGQVVWRAARGRSGGELRAVVWRGGAAAVADFAAIGAERDLAVRQTWPPTRKHCAVCWPGYRPPLARIPPRWTRFCSS